MEASLIQHRTRSRILHSRAARSLGLVVASAAAALAVWVIAVPVLGIALTVSFGPGPAQDVAPAAVALTAAAAAMAGWGLLAVLARAGRHGRSAWTAIAAGVAALSLAAPLSAGTAIGTKLALAAMHLVVAAILIPSLPRLTGAAHARPMPAEPR